MNDSSSTPGVLILEDGVTFPGYLKGSLPPREGTLGEVVFNTAMTGYQEVLTDPSYSDQIVVMTAPHQGNYGIGSDEGESSRVWLNGFIMREVSTHWSHHDTSRVSLISYLTQAQVPILTQVDTRSLTLHLRTQGALRGVIIPATLQKDFSWSKVSFPSLHPIHRTSTPQPYWFQNNPSDRPVVVLDLGIKTNILRELSREHRSIYVMSSRSSSAEILKMNPSCVLLSNGPGDPAQVPEVVSAVRELFGKVPIRGICMGQQILGLALGAKTYKLKFGHRGVNHPVWNDITKKTEISSHNHGYAVDTKTLPSSARVTHWDLNDQVCEGFEVASLDLRCVQFHPESAPGPHDSKAFFKDVPS